MGENSKIEWTDHTFNPWIGCTKVSPGCAHCYAERDMERYGKAKWGAGQPRVRTAASTWAQPLRWDRAAAKAGRRDRVFCASLADVFDDEVPMEWRRDLGGLIQQTPSLDWLLLTKRPQNVLPLLDECMTGGTRGSGVGARWLNERGRNVWIGTTVEDQQRADERIPELLKIPARVRFLSCEPLLGPVDLRGPLNLCEAHTATFHASTGTLSRNSWKWAKNNMEGSPWARTGVHWIIAGGESGPKARPMHPDWARSLRDQAQAAGVPFLFKQWGEWAPGECIDAAPTRTEEAAWLISDDPAWSFSRIRPSEHDGLHVDDEPDLYRFGKKRAGRSLDGRTWDEVPLCQSVESEQSPADGLAAQAGGNTGNAPQVITP